MKQGGILSHLAELEEESPYKPEAFESRLKSTLSHIFAHKDLQGSA